MLGASTANVLQARPEIRRFPLYAMLAWSMAAGAVIDTAVAFAIAGPPTLDTRALTGRDCSISRCSPRC